MPGARTGNFAGRDVKLETSNPLFNRVGPGRGRVGGAFGLAHSQEWRTHPPLAVDFSPARANLVRPVVAPACSLIYDDDDGDRYSPGASRAADGHSGRERGYPGGHPRRASHGHAPRAVWQALALYLAKHLAHLVPVALCGGAGADLPRPAPATKSIECASIVGLALQHLNQ